MMEMDAGAGVKTPLMLDSIFLELELPKSCQL